MQLHDRDLELESVGDDVYLLQRGLQAIGLPIDANERDRKLFGPTTHQAVTLFQNAYADALREQGWQGRAGVVERATAALISSAGNRVAAQREAPPLIAVEPKYRVSGAVKNAAGESIVHATVTVSNQNLMGAEPLGTGMTGPIGAFEITFDFRGHDGAEARSRQQGPAPDLHFAVVDADGHERKVLGLAVLAGGTATPIERIAPSPDAPFIIVNASTQTNVLLHVDEPPGRDTISEFEEVEARLAPTLQGLSYDELSEGDGRFQVSFLERETGIVRAIIERLIVSAKASRVTADRRRLVPVAVFYGLGHAALPIDLAALSRLTRIELTSALHAAVTDTVIPRRLSPDIDRHVDALLSVGAEQALAEPLGDGSETPRAWLALAGLTAEGQQLLLRELADHEGADGDVWQKLRTDPAMGGPENVRRAEFVLRLASFTGNNFALVRLLLDPQYANVQSVADLAKLEEPAWLSLVARAGVPEAQREEGESACDASPRYALGLMRVAQQCYPTAAIEGIAARSHRELALDPDVSQWLGAAQRAAEAGAVPAIDLRSTHIDRYFEEHAGRIDFHTKSTERLRSDLKRVQRTLAIVQEPAQIVPLLREGHSSALQVANMPDSVFVEIHSAALGVENARAIHARARQVHFAHLFVHTMVFEALRDERTKT